MLLRRYALEQQFEKSPIEALTRFGTTIDADPTADKVYAMAELAYVAGKRAEADGAEACLDLYGLSVAHAYHYLFDPLFDRGRNPYDPNFRTACDLYNGSLESVMRIIRSRGELLPGKSYTMQACGETWEIRVELQTNRWKNGDFERFEFTSDYDLTGLRNHHRTYGLGVPLVAVCSKEQLGDPAEHFYPPELSVPLTAFLRVVPQRANNGRHQAVLELHDPLASSDITVAGQQVPLENDLSTPLAYFLAQPEFDDTKLATSGLLDPDEAQKIRGLYMVEPYDPQKIPVIMIHGLWSSPVTWMEMFNDLRAEKEIRDHYQFWFYLYPTGQPFWYSARQMREDLAVMRRKIDPSAQSAALNQMILVGHSMGGLVGKLQTLSSGDEFWRLVSSESLAQIKADDETKGHLAATFYFEPNPAVQRVVTISTPHRGSKFANTTTRWLGRKLIELPEMPRIVRSKLARDNPELFRGSRLLGIETSIDSLAPESPILPTMLAARRPRWVRYHNIVGIVPDEGWVGKVAGGTDGVVAFESAHLENAASEITVPSDHIRVHTHPLAVLEVRRVLLQHLGELNGRWRPPQVPYTAAPSAAPSRYAPARAASWRAY
jgi:triacylglycerol esterase/lipase EstA (alpha/beta hydrolase family)